MHYDILPVVNVDLVEHIHEDHEEVGAGNVDNVVGHPEVVLRGRGVAGQVAFQRRDTIFKGCNIVMNCHFYYLFK